MEHKVKLEITLTPEFLRDVYEVATGSAVAYWAQGGETFERIDNRDYISIIEDEESETGKGRQQIVLSPANLALGIQRVLDPAFKISDRIRSYVFSGVVENDAGYIDDDAADAIVQAALFNDLVYG